jgi:oxygen-independent coproporphyrinogen III oxidase
VIPQHLYVHVPFCLRRCSYCDFAVTAMPEAPTAAWLAAIKRELAGRAVQGGWAAWSWRTVYIGGGTPSMLGPNAMAELLTTIGGESSLMPGAEWTAEANPETLSVELAAGWRAAGVNRLSIGVQTFHEPTLRWMGRLHGASGARAAVAAARAGGIENVSIDLIFGVPERLGRDWHADLETVLELDPQHVSLYGLTAEAATPLGRRVDDGRETLVDEDGYAAEYTAAVELLTSSGYEHYEVSNFAKPGRESRHNRAYWDGSAYLGLGPGAHSFLPPRRIWNLRDWLAYRLAVETSGSGVDGEESILGEAAALEQVWLGLRSDSGLELGGLTPAQRALVRDWHDAGLADLADGRVRLTPGGWLLLDRLSVELSEADRPAVPHQSHAASPAT